MTSPRPSRDRRRRLSVVSLVAAAGVAAALVAQGTTAGFTAGMTGKGTFSSGSAILADTIGGTTCTSSPSTVTTNATSCTTNPLPNGTLPASAATSQTKDFKTRSGREPTQIPTTPASPV